MPRRALAVLALSPALVAACGGVEVPVHEPVVVVPVQPPAPPASAAVARAAPDDGDRSAPVADAPPRPFAAPSGAGGRTAPLREVARRALTTKWTAHIGKTTFRTTMAAFGGTIVVGTHGDSLGRSNEASDGVYVVDAKTGKVLRRIATPGAGDKDVGGVAVDAGFVVFTTDNAQVVKARLADGAIAWTAKLGGKVRPAPALADLDGAGAKDVVVGDEQGTLVALAGDTGKPIWSRVTGKNDYDAGGFVAAAAIVDVDGDGKDDVVAGARDGRLVAYRGRDGVELWRADGDSGIHASPAVVDVDGDGRAEILAAWSYGRLAILDAATGAVRWEQTLELDDGGIEGLFGSPIPVPARARGVVVQATSWWGGKRGGKGSCDGVIVAGQRGRAFRTDEGRVSATPIVMDVDDDGAMDAVLGTEAGELLAIGVDGGTRALLAKLGGAIEASALAADVDGDGTYELLVASNDGALTCLSTGSRTKPLVPRFRGASADNRGDLGKIVLGWEEEEPGAEERRRPTKRPGSRR